MADPIFGGLEAFHRAVQEPHIRVPDAREFPSSVDLIAESNYASEFCEKIKVEIAEFEKEIDQEHEVGLRLVSYGSEIRFHFHGINYHNPSLVIFDGVLDDGGRVRLVQHVSQISFVLMALKKLDPSKPPRRMGFHVPKETQDEE